METQKRFRELLRLKGWSQEKAADEIRRQLHAYGLEQGCSQSWISAIISGVRRPTLELAVVIADLSEGAAVEPISPRDWMPTRRRRPPAKRAA